MNELKPQLLKFNNELYPKKATELMKSKEVNDPIFGLVMSYCGATSVSQVGKVKTGSIGPTTHNLPLTNKNFTDGCKLVAYASNLGITGENPSVVDFYNAVTPTIPGNKAKMERFKFLGSPKMISNVESISVPDTLKTYSFLEGPSEVFNLTKEYYKKSDYKKIFLEEFKKLSEDDQIEAMKSFYDSKGNPYSVTQATNPFINFYIKKKGLKRIPIAGKPEDKLEAIAKSLTEPLENTLVEPIEEERRASEAASPDHAAPTTRDTASTEHQNIITDDDGDIRDDDTAPVDVTSADADSTIPVESDFDKVVKEILEKNKDNPKFKIDGRIKNVTKLKKKYL